MGNPGQNLPDPNAGPSPSKESFLGIPLRGWAVFAVSLIAVCATLVHYSIRVYGDWQEQKKKTEEVVNEKQKATQEKDKVESVNQITSMNTNLITQEMSKHRTDKSGHQFRIHSDNGGDTVATYFESDGCIAITRPGARLPYLDHPGDNVEWSLGPSLKSQIQSSSPSPSATSAVRRDHSASESLVEPSLRGMLAPHGDTSHLEGRKRPRLMRVQEGCLNPHPWPFQSWWGPANGCFAPLYRKWNDGCMHYQMYNSCTGQWDPRIFWTTCNPNHHP